MAYWKIVPFSPTPNPPRKAIIILILLLVLAEAYVGIPTIIAFGDNI